MAADFSKIINHPEKDRIITKLVTGDPPKTVAEYLKLKYDGPNDAHLRVSISALSEFRDKYLNRFQFIQKLVKDNKAGKLDKKIAESLLTNKAWQERLADFADKEIDVKRRIQQLVTLIEARAEQVFDAIQMDPENFKGDYVLIKYFDTLVTTLATADKVINERPDTLIQNNISIQMVEERSAIMQEAIRRVLLKMSPELAAEFMDELNAEMANLTEDAPKRQLSAYAQDQKAEKELDKTAGDLQELTASVPELIGEVQNEL